MREHKIEQLSGRTVKECRVVGRWPYDYQEFVLEFTDGTRVRFYGNSSADACCELVEAKKAQEKK